MNMDTTTACQRYGKDLTEAAEFFRSIAWIIDDNPDSIMNYVSHPVITRLTTDTNSTCLQRTKILEALAYGDAGVMLAAPGPSLSGILLHELGTAEQKEIFFDHVRSLKARTFMAVTEPEKGSDPYHLQTQLLEDNTNKNIFWLAGEKWLIGNGASGIIGTVIVRSSYEPLGISAILLTPEDLRREGLYRTKLSTAGMNGVQLSYFEFNHFKVLRENILGQHLKSDLTSLVKSFNRMRPNIGALAIGLAQAVIDYIAMERTRLKFSEKFKLDQLTIKLEITRQLLQKAAYAVDSKPLESTAISSLAKINATHLTEEICAEAFGFFGQGSFFKHPWLAKWYRDAFAFEYMEGTTDTQRNYIFEGIQAKSFRQ